LQIKKGRSKFTKNKEIMKLELKHLAPYLPYGLKCQYEGIVNGGEISKKRKEYKKENEPFVNWSYFRDIDEIKGLKIAPLKSIRVYKKYWVATCGIYNKGQKGFYSGIGIKPILRPLSDIQDDDINTPEYLQECCYSYVQHLLEQHYDVFGLIPQGLAIDINTLNP